MEIISAIILGLVEGLTEFVPISSTGHLILTGHMLGFEGRVGQQIAAALEVFIQLGAVLAVVVAYPGRFAALLRITNNRGFSGARGLGLLLATTLPAALLGLATHSLITEYLFCPLSVAFGLFAGGLWILGVERRKPRPKKQGLDAVGWTDALVVGLFQCLSLWPGVSRSAATILGGMAGGLDRRTATEYSFFAAVAIIPAAGLYELYKVWPCLSPGHFSMFAVGTLVAFLAGWMAVKCLIRFLSHHTLSVFGWYRLVVALLVTCTVGWPMIREIWSHFSRLLGAG